MQVAWLGAFLAAVAAVGAALALPPTYPMRIRVWLLFFAIVPPILLLINGAVSHWLQRRRPRRSSWAFGDCVQRHIAALRIVAVLAVTVGLFVSEPSVSSQLTPLVAPRPPQLRFYCGDSEVVTDEKREIEMAWIPGGGLSPPNIWVVNLGGVSATDIHGQWFVSERLDQLSWNPGDKKYPRAAAWQINKLHPMEGQPVGGFSTSFPQNQTPNETLGLRLEAHYNGLPAAAEFTLRLAPVARYDESSLPCVRPSFLRLPSSAPR
jgi:hypothetical protein